MAKTRNPLSNQIGDHATIRNEKYNKFALLHQTRDTRKMKRKESSQR